jgi:hypothetical protein
MIDWWSNWISAIAGLKLPPIDTAATALPLGEAVADRENALSGHKGPGNIIELLWRFGLIAH